MPLRRQVTNIFTVVSQAQWPETLDPFIIYNVLYELEPFGPGLYCTDGEVLVPLADKTWVSESLGLSSIWKWSDVTTGAGIPAAYMRANNAQIKNATKFFISNIDVSGNDLGAGMQNLFRPTDEILITNVDRAGLTMFTLADPPWIDQGTYLEINVLYFEGGKQNPQNDDLIQLTWYHSPAPGTTRMDIGDFYGRGIPKP